MDIAILCVYIISAALSRKLLFGLCALPSLIAIIIPESYYRIDLIPVTFSVFAVITSAIALLVYSQKKKLTAYTMLLMAFYCVIFALDSVINKDYATWIYNNHEDIITGIHALILMSFSERVTTWLDGTFRNIGRHYHNFEYMAKNKTDQRSRKNQEQT